MCKGHINWTIIIQETKFFKTRFLSFVAKCWNVKCCSLFQIYFNLMSRIFHVLETVARVVLRGKTWSASKATTEVVPWIKLRNLFNKMEDFWPPTDLELTYFLKPSFDKVETFLIVFKFVLNCTQIRNFDDIMSNPPSPLCTSWNRYYCTSITIQ